MAIFLLIHHNPVPQASYKHLGQLLLHLSTVLVNADPDELNSSSSKQAEKPKAQLNPPHCDLLTNVPVTFKPMHCGYYCTSSRECQKGRDILSGLLYLKPYQSPTVNVPITKSHGGETSYVPPISID